MAITDYAVLYGTATVETGGAPDLLQRLGRVYGGPEFEFPLGPDPAPGYVLRTRITHVTGHGPWAGQSVAQRSPAGARVGDPGLTRL